MVSGISVILQKPPEELEQDVLQYHCDPEMIQTRYIFLLPSVSLHTNPTFAETSLATSKTVGSGPANYEINYKMRAVLFSIMSKQPLSPTKLIYGTMSR